MGKYIGFVGIIVILGIAYLMSNNKKRINLRTVGVGLLMQVSLAFFILKTEVGSRLFQWIGNVINKVLGEAEHGAEFVFGPLYNKALMEKAFGTGNSFVFFFDVTSKILFVAVLVNILYHLGIMQRIVAVLAKGMKKLMGISGAEALSNVASAFVGQVEAQIMIKPYLKNMTMSELLSSMTGSFACIAGGVMAVYISLGVPAPYLLAASLMAAPGALVISKIVWPETEVSETMGDINYKAKETKQHQNLLDAISYGASEGLKISLNVIAMLIGFIGLIYLVDAGLWRIGYYLWGQTDLSLNYIFGKLFSGFAYIMGVPKPDIEIAGSLMGTKMVVNEFVAYLEMLEVKNTLDPRTLTIVSFALCGFANFSSIAIQVGGIGELAPSRRGDLAKIGFKALICGTLASYLSATIAGLII